MYRLPQTTGIWLVERLETILSALLFAVFYEQRKIIIGILILAFAGQLINIALQGDLAIENYKYSSNEQKINELKIQNELLKVKIANQSSEKTILPEAVKLGFVPAKVLFLK